MKTRVFLAEGESHVRAAMRLLLEYEARFEVCGEADRANAVITQVSLTQPDILLLDWSLPNFHPEQLIPLIRQTCPRLVIIGLGVHPEYEQQAKSYGINACVLKTDFPEHILGIMTSLIPC